MHVALLREPGRLELADIPEPPAPLAGEALVAVRRVGLCGTDFHAFSGRQNFFAYPRVLGHELAVEVLALGPGADDGRLRVGDQCAVLPYLSCGSCRPCRSGRSNCCERINVLGVTVDGGLAERMVVPTSALYPRAGLSLDQLALVETLGIGMHAVQRSRPEASDTALIIGMGPIGLGIAQCLAGRVETVLVTDQAPHRLAFAERWGKVQAIPADENLTAALTERADGLPSVVFDATGSRASMERAFELTGPGGRLVLVGHTTGVLEFENPLFHRREMDLLASRNSRPVEWAAVLDLVSDHSLDALPWITHRPTLDSVCTDLPELVADGRHLVKAVVQIGADA